MPVQPTYPGVYVQEVPSGVRTIAGVSTSVASFIGRTQKGPMNEPVLCLSYSDFEREFSSNYVGSDMARAVRLFFLNGGTQCYVTRIAAGAAQAEMVLQNQAGLNVLQLVAKSPGLVGNDIRFSVTYNGRYPESTFNLTAFQWTTNNAGQQVQSNLESLTNLSMNPLSARYAATYITQNSSLVDATDLTVPADAAATGYSLAGRPVASRTNTIFRTTWMNLIGTTSVGNTNNFRISVDGNAFVEVSLAAIDFSVSVAPTPLNTGGNAVANLPTVITEAINNFLPTGVSVTATIETGPVGQAAADNFATGLLQIASANGDVLIEPSATDDLAQALMLGTAQGGVEVSKHANLRPVANGIMYDLSTANLVSLAEQVQTFFDQVIVGGITVNLTNTLQTSAIVGAKMFQDGFVGSVSNNSDGLREKLAIIVDAINTEAASNASFNWSAQLWGARLAILPTSGGDNSTGTIATAANNIGANFVSNTRYYSLGTSGTSAFQDAAGNVIGNDGTVPLLAEYRTAFERIEKEVDLFNLMVIPYDVDHTPSVRSSIWGPASIFCQEQRAFLLMDAPETWGDVQAATNPATGVNSLRTGLVKDHSAIFYPRLMVSENGLNVPVGPSGAMAGLMARIDASRGVWKAPAGTEADLRGITGIEQRFSDRENGVLNPQGINTIRVFPNGIVNWGARTMDGADDFSSEWKYIPVRRTALFMEESLYRGLKWVVFEPNDEPLWAQIRLNVGAFMHNMFRQGAFQGTTKKDAYFVKCDSETTTQNDINLGIVNIWVGFAPLKPAEFVILHLQQMTGQIEV